MPNNFFTRKSVKSEVFSTHTSNARLRLIQSLIKPFCQNISHHSPEAIPDAILCIQGIDGQYNVGSGHLLDYLLFGFEKSCRQEVQWCDLSEEVLDDVMLMVKQDSVHVYCNATIYPYLLPFIGHWRNLSVHCLTKPQSEDSEMVEQHKVTSLIEMLIGCFVVGVPYTADLSNKSCMTALKRWPMMQAIGLQEYQPGGYFSLNYEIVSSLSDFLTRSVPMHPIQFIDVATELAPLYSTLDPVMLETLILKDVSLLEKHWTEMIAHIDSIKSDERSHILKEKVEQPLKTYFNHGISHKSKLPKSIMPFVHFGKTSVKESLMSTSKGNYTVPITLQSCGVGGKCAPFMVCRAVSPISLISCTRTYFFMGDENSDAKSDLRNTCAIYFAMVQGAINAIRKYSETHDIGEAKDVAFASIQNIIEKLPPVLQSHLRTKGAVNISFEAIDNNTQIHPLVNDRTFQKLKLFSFSIYDIPSIVKRGMRLGSLIFAETFVESTLNVSIKGRAGYTNTDVLILTNSVPYFNYWTLDSIQLKHLPKEQPSLYNELIYISLFDNMNPVQGTLSVYVGGLALAWDSCDETIILWDSIVHIQVYRKDMSDVCVCIVTHTSPVPHLSHCLPTEDYNAVLYLHPKTKAYKLLNSQILPGWIAASKPVSLIPELPEELKSEYLRQQYLYEQQSQPTNGLESRYDWCTDLKRFLQHLEASCCIGSSSLSEQELNDVLCHTSGSCVSLEGKIPITIISGIPGSCKDNLACAIKRFTEEHNKWIVLNQRLDSASQFFPSVLHTALTSAVQSIHVKGPINQTTRILIITPGFTDTTRLVQAIHSHPDQDFMQFIVIGSVTCCIDPHNFFLSHRLTFPTVLNQCHLGWVNNVVVCSTDGDANSALVKSVIRSVNPDIPVFEAEQGEVTRTSELETILSVTAFTESFNNRHRFLDFPDWLDDAVDNRELYPPMNEIILRFECHLDRVVFLSEIKLLHKQTFEDHLQGNVYHLRGRVTFTDSEICEIHYTAKSNVLTWTKLGKFAAGNECLDSFLVFTGCSLDEGGMKSWLRKSTERVIVKQSVRSLESLTGTELAYIQDDNHLRPLSNGWFYNGKSYVNINGERADRHPDIDKFVKSYLHNPNEQIRRHNKTVLVPKSSDIIL